MKELTDLEICKRVAEIEGLESRQCGNVECAENHYVTDNSYCDGTKYYNPLTDDALCFQLMCKHGVQLSNYLDDGEVRMYWVCAEGVHNNNYDNPNKAICLAIIEAHKQR